MVKNNISTEMVNEGISLIKKLDSLEMQPEAALWFYDVDKNSWKFIIAEKNLKKEGPKSLYKKIQILLLNSPNEFPIISLSDIVLLDEKEQLISLLRSAYRTGKGISNIRFSQNVINGTMIEDALIYRL
ncbi:MAG: hypothetical protein NTX22_02235 [Ignavibacteriales bacterium]|nr:hypothetical protein [Ignavibacteriales bacterium]